ncbi:hypothetical protein [Streptomyces sp. NPDC093089]|uniref:hypothetical protein n=1 Tax=Streptomyces sp. NPDC093089 TaxID=3366024 RepID=UPI00380EF8C2
MTLVPQAPVPAPDTTLPAVPAALPAVPAQAPAVEPAPAAAPTPAVAPAPDQEPAAVAVVPEPAADPVRVPDHEPDRVPDHEPDADRTGAAEPSAGPRLRAVLVHPPTGVRGDGKATPPQASGAGDEPATAGGARPRFGTVPMPARAAQARRRDLPSVRAVRLTDEPPAPADRPASTAAAAVTPVPLPLPRPGTGTGTSTEAVPNESRTEEPQP